MSSSTLNFPCSSCGECCRRINRSIQTQHLDRGDGICRHLNTENNLCKIYDDRPLICRVKDYYQKYLINVIKWEDYVMMNTEICSSLQNNENSTITP